MKNGKEIKSLRGRREKHYLKENGEFVAYVYPEDVHYLKNGKYEEIDNTIERKNDFFVNRSNRFRSVFDKNDEMMGIDYEDVPLSIKLKNRKSDVSISALENCLWYHDILDNIDMKYEVLSDKIKESIVLKKKIDFSTLEFLITTNLDLQLMKDGSIHGYRNQELVYVIDAPFMEDGNHEIHHLVYYTLEKENNDYLLILHLDKEWLEDEKRVYPVVVDPTITVTNKANIYDTYIDSSSVNANYNNTDILKVGVDKVNNKNVVYRSLLKFDLPKIGTGSTVVDARLTLFTHGNDYGYYDYNDPIDVHMLTSSWSETSATWSSMSTKYNPRIFNSKNFIRSEAEMNSGIITVTSRPDTVSLTNIVRRWYAKEPNYGIMLKSHREIYDSSRPVHSFYSKNHKITNGNPTPYITITYVNKNGLEEYMSYEEYSFLHGGAYINRFNGNLTTEFLLGKTTDGKFPASLSLIYNTNDVVLNHDYGVGVGYQLSLYQTIKELTIEGIHYLEYLDRDGTLHYFYEKDGTYIDEDGLGISAVKENDKYILKDKDSNQMTFIKNNNLWYLTEIIDTASNKVMVVYEDGKISKVIDADGEEIVLSSLDNVLNISGKDYSSKIYYEDGKIVRLEGKDGSVYFSYNSVGVISKIIDVNGLSVLFEYYDVIPYKMKKMSEVGLHDVIGKSVSFSYEFDVTTIIDEKGRYQTYTFNKNGNAVGVTNLKGKNSLRNGIGKTQAYAIYPEKAINKLSEDRSLITSVANYIDNSSFEKTMDDSSLGDSVLISEDESRTGKKSLKITSSGAYERYLLLPKEKMYTFSAYVKTNADIKMYVSFTYGDGLFDTSEVTIVPNSDFTRYSVTFEYPEQATSCRIGFIQLEDGTSYIDDLQLEEGEIANHHNLIFNGNFWYDVTENWEIEVLHGEEALDSSIAYLIDDLDGGDKALHLKLDPDRSVTFKQNLGLSGKKNDIFNLSFWYRNTNAILDIYGESFIAYLAFHYTKEVPGHGIMPIGINYNCDEWQFFSDKMYAEEDYDDVTLVLKDVGGVNDFRLTNISLFKNVDSDVYVYDEEGNLTYVHNLNKTVDSYGYDKNNQLIGMFKPSGSNFKFEYDNRITDRLLNSISSSGISNKVFYDEKGNPVKTVIKNTSFDKTGEVLYYLRFKGSNKYFKVDFPSKVIDLKEDTCSYDKWKLEKEGEYYRINYSLLPGYYVTYLQSKLILTKLSDDRTLFTCKERKNGSYTFQLKGTNQYLCYENNNLGVKEVETPSVSDEFNNNFEDSDFTIQFYIENATSSHYIEELAEYTEDGKYVKKIIDDLGNVTKYDVDLDTGLVSSVTDSLGGITTYTYDTEEKMTSVTKNGKTVEYSYNTQKLLDTITLDNKEYHFIYDDFLNIKEIKVGNQTLITHTYEENNGKLLSSTYGNGDEVSYVYDELDRLIKETTMDNEYHYYYNNFGDMGKVEEVHGTYEYLYDFAKRLTHFRFNDFAIRYQYDNYSNIDEKVYQLGEKEKKVHYTYNKDDDITDILFDDKNLHYVYDDLGRLQEKSIEDFNKVTYRYLGHGNKTSFMISDYTIGEDTYHYTYDELNHITHIYKNNVLMNHYQYDDFYQLKREDDYIHQKSYGYQYDLEGNILKRVEYEFGTDIVLREDTYFYEDTNWGDKLTKYNNEVIEYDEIGNMVKFGNNKVFSWSNGRTLKTYNDFSNNLNISYQYDKDGIRIRKIVNGSETKYYTENNQIVFENRDNHMLYYIRDNEGNLEGFTYDDVLYYYIKNVSNDIIGILNSQGEKVATYEYDSWGNILDIKDGSSNSIKDNINHIANMNPFRYRSYYYDEESKLYYLNSRYYSPEIGRFINADGYVSTGQGIDGYNMFVYCNNDPVNCIDSSGDFWKLLRHDAAKLFKSAKKIIKPIISILKPVADFGEKAVTNFVFEIGAGKGAGAGFGFDTNIKGAKLKGKVGLKEYQDKTWGIKKGKTYTNITGSGQVGVGLVSVTYTYTHKYPFDPNESGWRHTPYDVVVISRCPSTKKNFSLDLPFYSTSKDENFIGLSGSIHAIIGIHVKIGWEIDK